MKIPVLDSYFNKERKATLLKKRLKHSCFLVNIVEFLRSPTLKNICERMLLSDVISTGSI